jgi:hypothetical protein
MAIGSIRVKPGLFVEVKVTHGSGDKLIVMELDC